MIAGIIAIAGYRYLAKRQPEYPNARVILTFALLGGALGGLLMALFDALAGIVVVSLDFVLIVAMLLACGVVGAMAAAILSTLVLPKAQ